MRYVKRRRAKIIERNGQRGERAELSDWNEIEYVRSNPDGANNSESYKKWRILYMFPIYYVKVLSVIISDYIN